MMSHLNVLLNRGHARIAVAIPLTSRYTRASLLDPATRTRLIIKPLEYPAIRATFVEDPMDLISEYRKTQEKTTPVIAQELGLIEGMKKTAKGTIAVISMRATPRRTRGITVVRAMKSSELKRNALKTRIV
jgi:hypothetical protein